MPQIIVILLDRHTLKQPIFCTRNPLLNESLPMRVRDGGNSTDAPETNHLSNACHLVTPITGIIIDAEFFFLLSAWSCNFFIPPHSERERNSKSDWEGGGKEAWNSIPPVSHLLINPLLTRPLVHNSWIFSKCLSFCLSAICKNGCIHGTCESPGVCKYVVTC